MNKYSHPWLMEFLHYWPIAILMPSVLLMVAVLAYVTRVQDRRDEAARAAVMHAQPVVVQAPVGPAPVFPAVDEPAVVPTEAIADEPVEVVAEEPVQPAAAEPVEPAAAEPATAVTGEVDGVPVR